MLSILLPNRSEKYVQLFVEEIEKILPAHEIIVCNDSQSMGKGWAIREAFNNSKGDIVAFLDADGEIPCRMLLRLLPFIEDFDAVVGSKRITHSTPRRKVMTHLTRIWFRLLFGVQVDTQTGIKLFRRKALESLDGWDCNKWLFDAEILYRLQHKGFKLVEVPIECEIRKQLAFKTIVTIFLESLWLKWRLLFPAAK